ncbi:hypothetical protein Barb7_01781 [Bacteroidales bacterium Barb7]|nr:hypothetical protein Barb7_01781 [Bacteroidales bacterium Barb7]
MSCKEPKTDGTHPMKSKSIAGNTFQSFLATWRKLFLLFWLSGMFFSVFAETENRSFYLILEVGGLFSLFQSATNLLNNNRLLWNNLQ